MDYHRVIDYGRNREMQGAIQEMPWLSPIGFIVAIFFFFFSFGNYQYQDLNTPISVTGLDLILGKQIAASGNYTGINQSESQTTIFRKVQLDNKDLLRRGATRGKNASDRNNQNSNQEGNEYQEQGSPYADDNNNDQIYNEIQKEMGTDRVNTAKNNGPIEIPQNMWVILAMVLAIAGIGLYFLPMPRQKFLYCAIAGVFGFLILLLFRQTIKTDILTDASLRSVDFQFGFMGALMSLLAAGIANGVLFKNTPEPEEYPEDGRYEESNPYERDNRRPPVNPNYNNHQLGPKGKIRVRKRRKR